MCDMACPEDYQLKCVNDTCQRTTMNSEIHPLETQLKQYLSGQLPAEELTISLSQSVDDYGTYIEVNGLGQWKSRINKLSRELSGEVSDEKMYELAELLLEIKAWEPHFYALRPVDTGTTFLTLQAGNEQSMISEWTNQLEENNRIVQVMDKMQEFEKES